MNELPELRLDFKCALVVGIVRNSATSVASDITRIIDSLELYIPTLAFIVESDSTDKTQRVLEELTSRDSRIRTISLGNIEDQLPNRIERITHCRNHYVREIRENSNYQECDLVIVADLDGVNSRVNSESFKVALSSEVEWDVLSGNQSKLYYDIYALRHQFWAPNNWIAEESWLKDFIGERKARQHAVFDRMIHIPSHLPPIEVESAFGGISIYKRWVFDHFDYTSDLEDKSICEHVALNSKIRDRGGRIFIHPGLINTHWTTHSLNANRFVSTMKRSSRIFPVKFLLPILRRVNYLYAKFS